MPIQRYNYQGDTNIGFYVTLSDEYVIIPRKFDKDKLEAEKIVETRIAGTRMVGMFTAGNSNCLLLPESIKEREKERIEKSGINFHVLDSQENALGNIILANDKGALISPDIEDKKEEIEQALEVPVETIKIAGIPNPGVCGIANSQGAVIHRDASEEEAEIVKDVLKVEDVNIGTINTGSPYMGSGTVASNNTILVGEDTSGPEIGRIDRVMVEKEE